MRTRANPALIGGFVLGAIALTIAAVLMLGAGAFFRDTIQLVAFFPGSVNGLSVGAPVKFKGVEIGRVTRILLALDEAYRTDFQIPVFFELDPERMTQHGAVLSADDFSNKAVLSELYKIGFRARLESESILTGVLYVEIDIHPGTPYKLQLDEESPLREMPTLPTTIDQATSSLTEILDKIENLDLNQLITSLNETVSQVNDLLGAPELKGALKSFDRLLANADTAVVEVRELVDSTRGNVDGLSGSLRQTLERVRDSLARLDATVSEAGTALESVDHLVDSDSQIVHQLARTLRSLDEAARSVRRLADSLERNPSSLVYGRPEDETE